VDRPSSRLGKIIRRQRELNRLTLRQFADMAGISNPYLSQIERGLKMPSEDVMSSIARTLKTSLDDLYDQAGVQNAGDPLELARSRLEALLEEEGVLSSHQRRVLLDVYDGLVAAGPATRPRPREGGRPQDPGRTTP
jgi:transcriptional regulator with XRE-family HTH domain